MRKNKLLSKLIYFAIALALLASTVVVGCAQEEPTAPTAPTAPTTPTAPTAPTTPTAPAAPTTPAGVQPQYGGTFRMGQTSGPYVLGFPPEMYSTWDYPVASAAIDRFFRLGPGLEMKPWLATGYSSDYAAKTVTITLRQGVKFSDATDFNAEAAAWIFDHYKATAAQGSEYLQSVDVIDDYTVRLNLSEWDIRFFTSLTSSMGGVYSPTAYEQNGAEWALNNPVSTGPFVLTYYERSVGSKYVKREGYWQEGLPYLDALEIETIADPLTRELALRNGDIDAGRMLPATQFAGLEKDGFRIDYQNFPSGTGSLTPDSANPASPWSDVRVRQAASHAIDREAIVDAVLFGIYAVSNQFAAYPEQFGYNPDVVGYPYNPTRAKELLAEAGYPNGFKTKMTITSTPGADQSSYIAVQDYFQKVGIEAELELATAPKTMAQGIGGEGWEGLTVAYTRTGESNPLIALMHSFYTPRARTMMARPREWINAVDEAVRAPDMDSAEAAMRKAAKLMIDKYAMIIPTWQGFDSGVYWPYVHDTGYLTPEQPYPVQATWEKAWMEPH